MHKRGAGLGANLKMRGSIQGEGDDVFSLAKELKVRNSYCPNGKGGIGVLRTSSPCFQLAAAHCSPE